MTKLTQAQPTQDQLEASLLAVLKLAQNATIERCAQVLEKRRNNLLKDGTGPTLLIAEAMKGDIAAIRALKDKP